MKRLIKASLIIGTSILMVGCTNGTKIEMPFTNVEFGDGQEKILKKEGTDYLEKYESEAGGDTYVYLADEFMDYSGNVRYHLNENGIVSMIVYVIDCEDFKNMESEYNNLVEKLTSELGKHTEIVNGDVGHLWESGGRRVAVMYSEIEFMSKSVRHMLITYGQDNVADSTSAEDVTDSMIEDVEFEPDFTNDRVIMQVDDNGEELMSILNYRLHEFNVVEDEVITHGSLNGVEGDIHVYEGISYETKEEMVKSYIWEVLSDSLEIKEYDELRLDEYKDATRENVNRQADLYGLPLEEFITSAGMDMKEYEQYIVDNSKSEYVTDELITFILMCEGIETSTTETDSKINLLLEEAGLDSVESASKIGYTREWLEKKVLTDELQQYVYDNYSK